MKKIFAICVMAMALVGCEKPVKETHTYETYRVLEVKRPKHFRVTLQNVRNGYTKENVNVSKHCSRWQEVQVGSEYTLATHIRYWQDNTRSVHIEARSICPR